MFDSVEEEVVAVLQFYGGRVTASALNNKVSGDVAAALSRLEARGVVEFSEGRGIAGWRIKA